MGNHGPYSDHPRRPNSLPASFGMTVKGRAPRVKSRNFPALRADLAPPGEGRQAGSQQFMVEDK